MNGYIVKMTTKYLTCSQKRKYKTLDTKMATSYNNTHAGVAEWQTQRT